PGSEKPCAKPCSRLVKTTPTQPHSAKRTRGCYSKTPANRPIIIRGSGVRVRPLAYRRARLCVPFVVFEHRRPRPHDERRDALRVEGAECPVHGALDPGAGVLGG